MNIAKVLTVADLVTLANAFSGVLAIYCMTQGYFTSSILLILLAMVFDGIDGRIARLTSTSTLGKDLDSLSDIISFGVAPALFALIYTQSLLLILPALLFVSCGILRLARFNVSPTKGYFEGMPITANGFILPFLYFLIITLSLPATVILILYMLAASVAMVSSMRVKKW